MFDLFLFEFGHKMDGRLVFIFGKMTIHTIIACIDLTTGKPFPAGRIAGVQGGMPVFIPIKNIRVFLETIRKIVQTETVENRRIRHVGLGDKLRGWMEIFFLPPVNCNFRFGSFDNVFFRHKYPLSVYD